MTSRLLALAGKRTTRTTRTALAGIACGAAASLACDGSRFLVADGTDAAASESDGPAADAPQQGTEDAASDAGDSGDGRKRIFVSSVTHTGAFGGVAFVDAFCQDLASRAHLPGEFQAWISVGPDGGIDDVIDRIAANGGPWYQPGTDKLVFTDRTALTRAPLTAIDVTEEGVAAHDATGTDLVWTGTNVGGRHSTSTCGAWDRSDVRGQYGHFNAIDSGWTDDTTGKCDVGLHVYCLQK